LTDYAFAYNYLEGDLVEPSTVFNPPRLGDIPHEPRNLAAYNLENLSDQPDKTVILGPHTESYIKF
jgi:hypothetical protein